MSTSSNSLFFSPEKVYEITYPSFVALITQAGKDQGASDTEIKETLNSIPYHEICSGIVRIMNNNLSDNALAAIDEFYSSPAGEEIIAKLPRIYAESFLLGAEIAKNDDIEIHYDCI